MQSRKRSDSADNDRDRSIQRTFASFGRFLGWTLGFTGFYTMTMNCPCCGQSGCPVGMTGAGLLGMLIAFLFRRRSASRRLKCNHHHIKNANNKSSQL